MQPLNSDNKSNMRKCIVLRRDSIPTEIRNEKNAAIQTRLMTMPQFAMAKSVLLYASYGSEVDTWQIIAHCLSAGITTALPLVSYKDDRLHLYQILSMEDLAPGYKGIPEPYAFPNRELFIEAIDLVITPGLVFDESCNRLGHCKGFYDRLLASAGSLNGTASRGLKPFLAALAYEEQVVPSLYCGPYDIKMDTVITDKRTIYRHGP
jgi:5-formyltetrahydrofolate cyclo-ligase